MKVIRLGVILAAGGSQRMGEPKARMNLTDGEPLIREHIERFLGFCKEVRVSTGGHREAIQPLLQGATEVFCPQWQTEEMRHSILHTIHGLNSEDKVLITPVDCPPMAMNLIARLCASEPTAALGHGSQPGHPLLTDVKTLQMVLGTHPLHQVSKNATLIEAGPEAILNINTPADWDLFQLSKI